MVDDFSNYPMSLAERRATDARNGVIWTPRDALISLLRDIDSGTIKIDVLCVVHKENVPNGDYKLGRCVAGADRHAAAGLLLDAVHNMFTDGD